MISQTQRDRLNEIEKTIPEAIIREHYAGGIVQTIDAALISFLTIDEIVEIFDYACMKKSFIRSKFIERIWQLCEANSSNIQKARSIFNRLADDEKKILSNRKRVVDEYLFALVGLLSDDEQTNFAIESLKHRRESRRRAGLRIIRNSFLLPYKSLLIDIFEQSRDERLLTTLTRVEVDITDIAEILLCNIHSTYEQMRVFEKLIGQDFIAASKFAFQYPMAFVWAAGRTRNPIALPMVIEILQKKQKDYKDVSLIVWALGKLGAKDILHHLADEFGSSLMISLGDFDVSAT